jgi:hypothetical protein
MTIPWRPLAVRQPPWGGMISGGARWRISIPFLHSALSPSWEMENISFPPPSPSGRRNEGRIGHNDLGPRYRLCGGYQYGQADPDQGYSSGKMPVQSRPVIIPPALCTSLSNENGGCGSLLNSSVDGMQMTGASRGPSKHSVGLKNKKGRPYLWKTRER